MNSPVIFRCPRMKKNNWLSASSLGVIVLAICGFVGSTWAAGEDAHAAHRSMMKNEASLNRSTVQYTVPAVTGISESGTAIDVKELLDGKSPLIVNFIFTSCQTICPVLSATFSQAQDALSSLSVKPRLVSFSIDPEYDTPSRLAEYAKQFHAGDDWIFVTGDSDAMLDIQKAFDAYRGDKLNHIALTFMRMDSSQPWVRYQGFMSAADLVNAYESISNVVARNN
jgi:protein SCO1/2